MQTSDVEILCAAFTPMFKDGTVNHTRVPDLFNHTVGTGVNGIFLNGTTGECMSLSLRERLHLVEDWTKARNANKGAPFRIVVHVGSTNLFEAASMAEHAQDQGADGFAMVPTFYLRTGTLLALSVPCAPIAYCYLMTPLHFTHTNTRTCQN